MAPVKQERKRAARFKPDPSFVPHDLEGETIKKFRSHSHHKYGYLRPTVDACVLAAAFAGQPRQYVDGKSPCTHDIFDKRYGPHVESFLMT